MKAILRQSRISPKKANLVAGMVRGKNVSQALDILRFTPKKAAAILYKVIHSAASNAKANFGQSTEALMITSILVTKGTTYQRAIKISRGRSHPIRKRTAHITVEVGLPAGEIAQPALKKEVAAEKEAPKKASAKEKPKKAVAAKERPAAKKTAKSASSAKKAS